MGSPKIPKPTVLPPPPTPASLAAPMKPPQGNNATRALGGTYLTSGMSGGGLLTKGKKALTGVLGG